VVCADWSSEADLDWAATRIATFANYQAGQSCIAVQRVIVPESRYVELVERIVAKVETLATGDPYDEATDVGPLISEAAAIRVQEWVDEAVAAGARVLAGGQRLTGSGYDGGFYMAPTLIEGAPLHSELACTELFGPIATVHRVATFDEAVEAANASPYGLTAAIWTRSIHRAQEFVQRIESGVAAVNGPTYGSEPHMPFGGVKDSGNGWREPGTEAIDVYSDLKTVYMHHDPGLV
jgi:aldehyde dehydrogenase (NAD+)